MLGTVIGNILRMDQDRATTESHKGLSIDISTPGFPGIVGKSPNFLFTLDQIRLVAPFDTSVRSEILIEPQNMHYDDRNADTTYAGYGDREYFADGSGSCNDGVA